MTATERAGTETTPDPPVTWREILGWAWYDVADSAFTTVIITTFYSLYFWDIVVGEEGRAVQLWGRANAVSAVVVALLAPIMGAIADYAGCRKRFLAGSAALLFVFTTLLWFTGPGTIALAMLCYLLANVGFAGGGVFIDSFLPRLAGESNAGPISGLKWAVGYAGGLVVVVLCLGLSKSIVPNPTPEQLSQARLIPLIVAGGDGGVVVGALILLRERAVPRAIPPGDTYLTVGFRQLKQTFRNLRRYRDLLILFVAFIAYNAGISTVIQLASTFV